MPIVHGKMCTKENNVTKVHIHVNFSKHTKSCARDN